MQANYQHTLHNATNYISKNDPVLASVIAKTGPCTIAPQVNHYQALLSAVIGQQLSVKAAATIKQRLFHLFGNVLPMPQDILATSIDTLRSVGLSGAKIEYIRAIAEHIMEGRLEINKLPQLDNQKIIDELMAIKGIGLWTAHMFLIFSLGRLDILPVGDLGIRTGAMRLYNLPTLPSATELTALATERQWQPYESVASWYIWRSLDNQSSLTV